MKRIKVPMLILMLFFTGVSAQNIWLNFDAEEDFLTGIFQSDQPPLTNRTQAMWVFPGAQNPNPLTDDAARRRLVFDSWKSGVNVLYVSVYQSNENSNGRLMYEDLQMARLINRAHRRNRQEVWAAYGAPDWAAIGCSPTAFPLRRMAEVADYNAAHRTTDKFDGVILDVESNEPQSAADFQALLNLYRCVRQTLPPNTKLAAAIRFFWDAPVAFPANGGAVKPVYQHIIDLNLDKVVVMGYRDFAGTSNCDQGDGIICLDKDEIAYATSINKPNLILIGLETRNPFPDLLNKETFYEEGQTRLQTETQTVSSFFTGGTGFGGYAIHNYQSAYLSGTPNWQSTAAPLP